MTAANPHGYAVVPDVPDRRPLVGEKGYRDFLNAAFEAGHLTERERMAKYGNAVTPPAMQLVLA